MKIAIIGVGAIGGYVGARLAHAGEDVTFIARGANLEALRTRGIRLVMGDGSEQAVPRVNATSDYAAAGPQDVVILAMKAHQVEAVAPQVPKLFAPDTVVVPMQNGIPFWYFHRHGGPLEGASVAQCSVDPTGAISESIPGERIVGCVVYPAAELLGPGIVKHIEGDRFPVGEPDGSSSERVKRVSECLTRSGLKAPVLDNIRGVEIWPQAMGQSHLQPHQRALARDARRNLPVSADPRAGARHDDRGTEHRRQTQYLLPRAHREADRRCRARRASQDLDAAGRGGAPPARDRRAARPR